MPGVRRAGAREPAARCRRGPGDVGEQPRRPLRLPSMYGVGAHREAAHGPRGDTVTDEGSAAVEVPDWTAMVLVSKHKRVRHLAVWAMPQQTPGPICRNRGDFPHYGYATEWADVPICTRCVAEVELLASTIRSADV